MQGVGAERRAPTIPLLLVVLSCAGLAMVLESRLQLPLRLPGHRALPGALALVLLAGAAPRAALLGFAGVVGVAVAVMAQSPLLALVWLAPATLLALGQDRSLHVRIAVAVVAGLAFGLVRYLALPDSLHHTPAVLRLAGHLAFGALGAVGVAREALGGKRKPEAPGEG